MLDRVRQRFREVNGEHPMSEVDDAYVRGHFVPVASLETDLDVPALMAERRLPLPSYLLGDGTPMVPAAYLELAEAAGGPDALREWFVAFWPEEPATGEREWDRYLDGQQVALREVTPVVIRQQARLVAAAAAAVAVLEVDPSDPVARGSLGEAVDGAVGVRGLDQLLLPMTAFDRLRFGGPTVRERWVDRVRAAYLSPEPPDLPLRTERLVLRTPRPGDADAFVAAWASPEWTRLLLSPTKNAAEVRERYRLRATAGEGAVLDLVVEHDGTPVGEVLLALQGTGLTEGELGWTVLPEHSGHGYATEAARELIRVGFEHYRLRRVVADLDERNDRSRALCERLGMRQERHAVADFWSKGEWTSSYSYALLADEWQASRGH